MRMASEFLRTSGAEFVRLTSGQQEALRWVAIVAMVSDHLAVVLLEPGVGYPLRVVGRVAWPLFAFLVAYNVVARGVDPARYLRPLLAWLLPAQLAWWLAFGGSGFNVLATLLLGVVAMAVLERGHGWWPWLGVVGLAVVGELAGVEYGAVGVLLPLAFAWALRLPGLEALIVATVAVAAQNWPWSAWPGGLLSLVLVVVAVRGGLPGLPRAPRWVAWSFYPAHLAVLVVVRWAMG